MSHGGMIRFWIPLTATLASLVALASMPYGYYMLLRVFFCMVCIYYLVSIGPGFASGHCVVLVILAVLYNPVLPVHLASKPLWSLANLGTVVYLWVLARQSPQSEVDPSAVE